MFRFNHLFDLISEKHPPNAGAFLVDNLKVERKAIKHLYLRIDPSNGQVCVSAPKRMKDSEIAQFLEQKQHWIERKRKQLQHKVQLNPVSAQNLSKVLLWGQEYRVIFSEAKNTHISICEDNQLHVQMDKKDDETIQHALNLWLRSQLQQRIHERLAIFEKISQTKAKECRIKAMKTRWGTCSIRAARVWINAELVQLPPICLDYIILHELVHLHEPSHNARFHALMTEFMPNWREPDTLLNRYILPK